MKQLGAKRKSEYQSSMENDKKTAAKYIKEKRLRDEESLQRARKLDKITKEGNKEVI